MKDYSEHCLKSLNVWIHELIQCDDLQISEIQQSIQDEFQNQKEYAQSLLNRIQKLENLFTQKSQNQSKTTWKVPVEVDGANADYYITLPNDLLDKMQWYESDVLDISLDENSNLLIRKV
jgi:hypothetical protein